MEFCTNYQPPPPPPPITFFSSDGISSLPRKPSGPATQFKKLFDETLPCLDVAKNREPMEAIQENSKEVLSSSVSLESHEVNVVCTVSEGGGD